MAREIVTVCCPDCGDPREISVRQRRRIANSDKDFRCALCRSIPESPVVTEADRKFWLDRYPIEWIVETGRMIWGDSL